MNLNYSPWKIKFSSSSSYLHRPPPLPCTPSPIPYRGGKNTQTNKNSPCITFDSINFS